MTHQHIDEYTLAVRPATRDYRGFFVQENTYRLAGITKTGWAQICLNDSACYYVDPENLFSVSAVPVA